MGIWVFGCVENYSTWISNTYLRQGGYVLGSVGLLLLYLASTFCWHGPLDCPVGGFLRYQSVGTATGPTALCGIRTTPRNGILSPENTTL